MTQPPVPPAIAEFAMQRLEDFSCRYSDGACTTHGGAMDRGSARGCVTELVLSSVRQERARQFARYGTNANLADGTGRSSQWLGGLTAMTAEQIERRVRRSYEEHEQVYGAPTWMHLVLEEVAEAFQEDDPTRLEAELVQVAALCVSWVEKLRERQP